MNKTRILAFVALFLLFLLQNASSIIFSQKPPSFVLIGVIFYALKEGPNFGFVIGCVSGLLLEIFGVGQLGFEVLILGLVGYGSGFVALKIFGDSLLTEIILPALAAYVTIFFNLLIIKISFRESLSLGLFVEAFLFQSILLTAFLSPLVFFGLKKITFKHLPRRKNPSW